MKGNRPVSTSRHRLAWRREHLRRGRAEEAIACLTRARSYPPNLGEGKLPGARENDLLYWLGEAHARRGDREQARACWEEAAAGDAKPAEARYYNDQPPEMIFYQGLALRRLGREDESRAVRAARGVRPRPPRPTDDDRLFRRLAARLPRLRG